MVKWKRLDIDYEDCRHRWKVGYLDGECVAARVEWEDGKPRIIYKPLPSRICKMPPGKVTDCQATP